MRHMMIVALVALSAGAAYAETYTYVCKIKGKSYNLKVDDARNVLTWRGTTYKIKVQDSCAKFGWRAERPGEAFDFCTATQGYAGFEENGRQIDCDQNR